MHAYDVVAWCASRPTTELNFPDAEFHALENFQMKEMTKKKKPAIHVAPDDSDNTTMARYAQEHPEYLQAERNFY